MKEQLITSGKAKLAKEKGFNIPIQHTVNNTNQLCDADGDKLSISSNAIDNWNGFDKLYSTPTQALLQKWLREIHNIIVEPIYNSYLDNFDLVYGIKKGLSTHIKGFKTYEEAL